MKSVTQCEKELEEYAKLVIEHGGVATASRAMGMSGPALGKRLKKLGVRDLAMWQTQIKQGILPAGKKD